MLRCVHSAREILAANLRHLMTQHPDLNDRTKLARRSGVSPRTIGYMLQSGTGNPTLESMEAVAKAFGKPVWHLFIDFPVVERLSLLDKILRSPAVPDVTLGDTWNANKTAQAPVMAEPLPPLYSVSKPRRRLR